MLTSCYQKAQFITLFVGGAEIKVRCVSLQDEIRADLDSKSVSDMSLDTISAVSNLSNASDSAGEQPSTPGVSNQMSPVTLVRFIQVLLCIVAT